MANWGMSFAKKLERDLITKLMAIKSLSQVSLIEIDRLGDGNDSFG